MKRLALVLAAVVGLGLFGASPTLAAPNESNSLANAVGLMVKYREGVAALSANGRPTGENFSGVVLQKSHDVGSGFTAVSFESPFTDASAKLIAENLRRDPRVALAIVDHDLSITPQSIHRDSSNQLAIALGTVLKPASAPLNVKVADSWSPAAPFSPRVKVTWGAPKTLNGGRLGGFQVWKSVGTEPFSVAQTLSTPLTRSLYLSLGLTAGTKVRVFVRAITRSGVAIKFGLPSPIASATPTTSPGAPTITGYSDSAVNKPQWKPLSLIERGGLPVTYSVSATAEGKATVTCSTTQTTCLLSNLAQDADYTIRVTAQNAHGSSSSQPAVRSKDPYFYQQWYLWGDYGINAPQAWAQLPTSYVNPVVVAVIDTGFTSHSDLNSQVVPGYDFVSSDQNSISNDGDGWDADASDPGSFNTNPTSVSSWHGTHVAGLIGAASNGVGIVGVAPGVKLQSVRALGGSGGKASDLLAAITWASGGTVNGVPANPTPAKVINISMGTSSPTGCDAGVEAAYQAALARGVTIVTSAGNGDSSNQPIPAVESYPGNCLGSINVGATSASGDASYFSNYGLGVDISAPGGDDHSTAGTQPDAQGMMISDYNSGQRAPLAESYAFDEGTSMAAPMISGAAALLYAKSSTMTPNLVWQTLKQSVKKFRPGTLCASTAGSDAQQCGVGIVDVSAALRLVK